MSLNTKTKRTLFGGAGVAVVAVAIGLMVAPATGANFSASDTGKVNIATANLSIGLTDNLGSDGTFNLNFSNLKPGEVQHQTFYVTNTGSIPATVKLSKPITGTSVSTEEHGGHGENANRDLNKLSAGISGITSLTPVSSLPSNWNLGSIAAGETKGYTLDVSLDSSAGNEWQNATIAANATVTLEQQ